MFLVVFVLLLNIMLKRRASKRFVLDQQEANANTTNSSSSSSSSTTNSTATSTMPTAPAVSVSAVEDLDEGLVMQQSTPQSSQNGAAVESTQNCLDQNSNMSLLTPNSGAAPTLK